MNDTNPVISFSSRLTAGAFAGAVFGSFAQLMFFWERPPAGQIKLPWMGALIGAVLVGTLSVVIGGRELPDWFRRLAVGFLARVVIGVLAGAFVFAPVMTALEVGDDSWMHGKVLAGYQQIGIALGSALGGVVGLFVGAGVWWYKRTVM